MNSINTKISPEKYLASVASIQKDPNTDQQVLTANKIKYAQLFFNKKFLGNKQQSIFYEKNKLIKDPITFIKKQQKYDRLFQLKTGNLNLRIKQIENIIVKDQPLKNKKINHKKINKIDPVFTEFQLYQARRDIIKQKNPYLQQVRIQYYEQKRLKQLQRQKLKQQGLDNEQIQKKLKKIKFKRNNTDGNNSVQNQNASNQQQIRNNKLQSFKSDFQMQKLFQRQILKNKFSKQPKINLKTLLNQDTKKDIQKPISQRQLIITQLNELQNVAKKSIQNFKKQMIFNQTLGNFNFNQQYQTQRFNSQRKLPNNYQNFEQRDIKYSSDKKSIDWVLKQCQNAKKAFSIRKSKSVKLMKKNN